MRDSTRKAMLVVTLVVAAGPVACRDAARATDGPGLSHDRLDAWLAGYEEAWETLDADKAASLFTEDATYRDDPYGEAHRGRQGIHEYWATVTGDQRDVDFTYEVLSVSGNTGIAHWHSEFTQESSGAGIVLDGIFVLEFEPEGLCSDLKEWWHVQVNAAEDD